MICGICKTNNAPMIQFAGIYICEDCLKDRKENAMKFEDLKKNENVIFRKLKIDKADPEAEAILKAIEKVYHSFNIVDYDIKMLLSDITHGHLSIHEARSGRDVIWYLDFAAEFCFYIDTLEELTAEQIEKELL